jgi:hypothetical protein
MDFYEFLHLGVKLKFLYKSSFGLNHTELINTVCDGPHVFMQILSVSCPVSVWENCFEQM